MLQKIIYPFCTLLILDGWGIAPYDKYNAVKLARTPNLDTLNARSFTAKLQASGGAVGLPEGIIGNSEVGHLNIGAGKKVNQEILIIDEEIENGKFFKNASFLEAIDHATSNGKKIHIIGLLSDALVHASLKHLFALLKLCADKKCEAVYIHGITDGRDTAVDASYKFITMLQSRIKRYGIGEIATICGRYYAMDRDTRWDRTQKAYNLLTDPQDVHTYPDALSGIRDSYNRNVTDEFIEPFSISPKRGRVENGDTIIFFNFRSDRARQLTQAFIEKDFHEFNRPYISPFFVSMTEYDKNFHTHIAYEKEVVHDPLAKIISDTGEFVFKIAETEKYAHVTYFLNGGRETAFPLEDRFLIPSLKIPTYDSKPQMRVFEITAELLKRIKTNKYKMLIANFANADMVGHTGNLEATIKACEYIDTCIGDIAKCVFEQHGLLAITADHGNAERKFDPIHQQIATTHTTNPVPFLLSGNSITRECKMPDGKLGDIAPTILPSLGYKISPYMTGNNLLA